MQYVDVMIIYHYISQYFWFPVGHTFIHVGNAYKDREACLLKEGLMKFSIVPPERLNHPMIPFRVNQKLMFSLCRTCVLNSNTGQCCHKTDEERALTDTWVIDELRLAVKKGYRILEIHELYEYNVTRYIPEIRECGLFSGYIYIFL